MSDRNGRVSVDDALALIEGRAAPLGLETVAVTARALGRVLAGPVLAAQDAPRFDCSAMDGHALRSVTAQCASSCEPRALAITAAVAAGAVPPPLAQGDVCVPISTGARIPAGADAVVAKESARVVGDTLVLTTPVPSGCNIRRRGEDIAHASQLVPAGTKVTPELLGALLNCGIRRIAVQRMPRVIVMSTGSEIVVADDRLEDAMRFDSNGPMIEAACIALGLPCRFAGRVSDDSAALEQAIGEIEGDGAEIVITTGGVSAGDHDLVREVLERRGARVEFHGIAMRPGKPLLFATFPDGRLWFGLPGNSIAAWVGLRFFVLAAVRRMVGLGREQGRPVHVDAQARPGLSLFLHARDTGPSGQVDIGLDQRSHIFNSLLEADCWVRLDSDSAGTANAWRFDRNADLSAP